MNTYTAFIYNYDIESPAWDTKRDCAVYEEITWQAPHLTKRAVKNVEYSGLFNLQFTDRTISAIIYRDRPNGHRDIAACMFFRPLPDNHFETWLHPYGKVEARCVRRFSLNNGLA